MFVLGRRRESNIYTFIVFSRFVNATRAGDMSAEELGEEGELGPVLELVKTLGFKGFLGAVMVADTICVNLIERSIFRKLLGGD